MCKRGVVGWNRDGSSCNGVRDKGILGSLRTGIGEQALGKELY